MYLLPFCITIKSLFTPGCPTSCPKLAINKAKISIGLRIEEVEEEDVVFIFVNGGEVSARIEHRKYHVDCMTSTACLKL
jgi:hypothetical protein